MTWGDSISITKAANGFILEKEEFLADDTQETQLWVFEEEADDEHVVTLLYEIVNHFGLFGARNRNLTIEWRKENE